MKFNLMMKSICVYVLIAVLGFASVSFITHRIEYHRVYEQLIEDLYRQTVSIAAEYAPSYFSNERLRIIELELNTIAKLADTRIMFIDTEGRVILDSQYTSTNEEINEDGILYTIDNFNIDTLGSGHSLKGDFYGKFDEVYISAFAPITNAFVMKGYVFVHLPESVIWQRVNMTFNTNYITWFIMVLLNISFIGIYVVNVHKPAKKILTAITEYGKGNLSYRTGMTSKDELGQLAVSLDYMASKLAEMDQFQQRFLSNISHDFRSPLTSIKGYLEAIADGTIPTEQQSKYIDIVLFETDRLTKLTSNILTLNELDPKMVRLEANNFDINALIKHTIETFEGNCKKRKIHFQLTYASEKELVHADKGKIGQVIYNLIDNAIKFSNDNANIYITVTEKGEKVHISIRDTGSGIPKEKLPKIWDRFYKSDSSRGRDKKGSGLGLSIVKEILQAHNENIDVISTEGVGTEFIFTLPAVKTSIANDEAGQIGSSL